MDVNGMLFPFQWHFVEKYDLLSGERRNPLRIAAICEKRQNFHFDHATDVGVLVETSRGKDKFPTDRLLVGHHEFVSSCLPEAVLLGQSAYFSFALLLTEEERTMAKMAFTFSTDEFDDLVPSDWFNKDLVRVA